MGTYLRAGIMTLCAVFLAYALKTVGVQALGLDPETNALDAYGDMMLAGRELFQEEDQAFQELTMHILEMDGLRLTRMADGSPCEMTESGPIPAGEAFSRRGAAEPEALEELTRQLFDGAEVLVENSSGEELVTGQAQVLNLSVSGGEVLFFTQYHERGCVGVAYAPDGTVSGMNTIDLVEDWKIFYEMAE